MKEYVNRPTPLEAFAKVKDRLEIWDCSEESNWEEYGTGYYECEEELDLIETTLKNYEELTNKPVILYGRTHRNTQALIDTICKNYKEVKITNIEDEKKLKALEIIKEKKVDTLLLFRCFDFDNLYGYPHFEMYNQELYTQNITKEEYDLLREVLLCG